MTMMLRVDTDDPAWLAAAAARDEPGRYRSVLDDRPAPPAAIITSEHAEELWRAVLDACAKLVPGSFPGHHGGSSTSSAYGSDGDSCSILLSREYSDGHSDVWFVEARWNRIQHPSRALSVTVRGPFTDSHDQHWQRLLDKAEPGDHVVCGHGWYSFGSPGGFGGQLFRWRDLATGAERSHRGMWYAGTIPPAWRERIPDTHEMLEGFAPTFTG
jgi:hypothetical protein